MTQKQREAMFKNFSSYDRSRHNAKFPWKYKRIVFHDGKRKLIEWTGGFRSRKAAMRWFRKYGKYWQKKGMCFELEYCGKI